MTEGVPARGSRMLWRCPAGVVTVVGAVGQVERLRDELQVHVLAEFEVLGQTQIELEEGIAAQGIVLGDGAVCGAPLMP